MKDSNIELQCRVLKARTRILNAVEKISAGQYAIYFRELYPRVNETTLRNVMNCHTYNLDYTIMAEKVADLVEERFSNPVNPKTKK
jgi:hypothetical protein